MQTFLVIIRPALALIVGAVIGFSFGLVQKAALRRHQEKEKRGEFKSAWGVMPGSGARIAYLLISLVAIQLICPMLFADGTQWWVSGGLAAAYGVTLYRQMMERRAALT